MFRICLAAAALALLPASAAARWSSPATLTASFGPASDPAPAVAISPSGRSLVVWTPAATGIVVAVGDRRGRFGAPRRIARHGHEPDVAIGDDGAALIAWADRGRAWLVARSARGRLGTPRQISPPSHDAIVGPRVAIASNGDAVIAWTAGTATWAALRTAGHLGAPQRLGDGALDTFGATPLAVDNAGDAAVAFVTRDHQLRVARRAAGATTFAVTSVGVPPATEPALAVDGDVTAAWIAGQGFESDFDGPLSYAASPFTTVGIGPPTQRAFLPHVVSLGFGNAAIAWQDRVHDTRPTLLNGPIRTITRNADGTITGPRTLDANPRARRPRLAPLSPFRALAVWTSTPPGSRRLIWRAARAGSDGRFVRTTAPRGNAPSFTLAQELATAGHYAALVWRDGRRLKATVGHL
jgi:hypothetical protein